MGGIKWPPYQHFTIRIGGGTEDDQYGRRGVVGEHWTVFLGVWPFTNIVAIL